jgi:DNA-binding beta-propeller fold protein YncE
MKMLRNLQARLARTLLVLLATGGAVMATAGSASAAYQYVGDFDQGFNGAAWTAIDPQTKDLYVTNQLNSAVVKTEASGSYLTQFGSFGTGPGQFDTPEGVAVDPSTGDVYVADANVDRGYGGRIEKFDSSGNYITEWDINSSYFPWGVAVDASNGDVYVAEQPTGLDDGKVEVFNSSGSFQFSFSTGSQSYPAGIAINSATGVVYVADLASVVSMFSTTGAPEGQFGGSGGGDGQFNQAWGIAIDPQTDDVFVVDGGDRVEEFDQSGKYVGQFGSLGSGEDQFESPVGIAINPDSRWIYVADRELQTVQVTSQVPPQSQSPPVVSGIAQDGHVLSSTTGSWSSPDPLSYRYQWLRCKPGACFPIAGATANSYQLTFADIGWSVTANVTATDVEHMNWQSTAAGVGPVAKPPIPTPIAHPLIEGILRVGQSLRATSGRWSSPDPLTFAYQWERCGTNTPCVAIRGATRAGYQLTGADRGHRITVLVRATDKEGQTGHATAPVTGPVAG